MWLVKYYEKMKNNMWPVGIAIEDIIVSRCNKNEENLDVIRLTSLTKLISPGSDTNTVLEVD